MPCQELFLEQPREYRDHVLPPATRARVAVEAATTFGWERFVGDAGEDVGQAGFFGRAWIGFKQLLGLA